MSVVNSQVSGEEGSNVTVECLYSERYRYLIVPFIVLQLCQFYLPSDHVESSNAEFNIYRAPVNLRNMAICLRSSVQAKL